VTPTLELSGVVKDYRGLRPLRLERLVVEPGEQLALLGFDRVTAELFVNLVTGATLPDAGEVRLFGASTSSITDSAEWVRLCDRFGIVSERAVLLDGLSVIQNLAVPFTLEIEPPSAAVQAQAAALAAEVGLPPDIRERRVGDLDGAARTRVRLGRALALDPSIVLLEHPSAAVPRDKVGLIARDIQRIIRERNAAALTLTADPEFARAVAGRVLALQPATGELSESPPGWLARLAKMARHG
jgi:ABC-type transporter Mla maintaining outer membrane lipid asymmetry ATPase subunit MlaF